MKIENNLNINIINKNSSRKVPNKLKSDIYELGVDISSHAEYPYNILSNFAETNFIIDEIQVNSMEGFLQALKTPDIEKQKEICSLSGIKAKGMGKKMNKEIFKKHQNGIRFIYWQGKKIKRDSKEYQELLERAYQARYNADEEFRFALEYSKDRVLHHSMGSNNPNYTILTEEEFIGILNKLRN